MATNLALDNTLIEEAKDLGGHRTKKAAVNEALQEYVNRRKRMAFLELLKSGEIQWDPEYDYKALRRMR
jgi:Arc/MetJ family transcription regulator